MTRDRDFISSNDALFDGRQKNLLRKLGATDVPASWNVPQQAYDNLLPVQAEWDVRYAAAKNPSDRTHAQVTAKNEARKTFEGALHLFIKAYLTYNPKLTDDEREALELSVHKKERKPAPAAHRYPFFHLSFG